MSADNPPDFLSQLSVEAEGIDQSNPDALARLRALAEEAQKIEDWLAAAEEKVSERKGRLNSIYFRDMVDLMDEAKVESLTVNGKVYEAGEFCKASIKTGSEHEDEAYTWLEQNEAGDLIKRDVVVSFPKEYQEEAEALARHARERYQMADTAIKRGVPWARLTSWVKEQRRKGATLPLELLGATVGRVVSLKKSREK